MRMVEICVNEMPKITHPNDLSIKAIFLDVCWALKVTPEDASSKCRKTIYVFCRCITSYVSRTVFFHNQDDIAAVVGFEDHSSVIHCLKRVRVWMGSNDSLFMKSWNKYKAESKIWRAYNEK